MAAKKSEDKKAAQRKAAAERQRKSRLKKLQREDPQAAAALVAEQEAAQKAEQEKQALIEQEKQKEAAKDAELERELGEALPICISGMCRILVSAYNVAAGAPPETPTLTTAQSDEITRLWMPVLRPMLMRHIKTAYPILALSGTIGVLSEYGETRKRYIKEYNESKVIDAQFGEAA